jgi:hypothetical protein
MSASLHTVFKPDTHLAEGQLLREEPRANRGKSLKLREGMRMPTIAYRERKRKNLHPLQALTD